MTIPWWPCFTCGARISILIGGLCEHCAPFRHLNFHQQMADIKAQCEAFHAETGKHPFDDWYRFERWLEERKDGI